MYKPSQWTDLLMITVLLCAPLAFAQNDEAATALPLAPPAEETTPQDTGAPPGQEVGINEDNYRQFMELKDPLQQREILPEDAYKPQSGLQKLENLPEESQKHLRNQLREVIVQGDQWQPGDEELDYPYVPSTAAGTNPPLQKQEAEAWDELVEGYHVREAEIFRNSTRSGTAAASTGASGEKSGNGEGSDGSGAGQGETGEQVGQESSAKERSGKDSYAPNSSNDPNAPSTAGVSQNALEFLQKSGNQDLPADSSKNTSSTDIDGQEDMQAQVNQQSDKAQDQVESAVSFQTSADERDTASTTGTSQNALEYLTKEDNPGSHNAHQSPDSVPLEASPDEILTIEDLRNAQGVSQPVVSGTSTGAVPDEDDSKDDQQTP